MRLQGLVKQYRPQLMAPGELDDQQRKAFNAAAICRTAKAGGSLYSCGDCSNLSYRYHSCGNRFCPACQNHRSSHWLQRQKQRLLPAESFMITFTVPRQLRSVPREQLADFYQCLFDSSSTALKELIADRLGGECGFFGVLHTHARNLAFHPHVHFVVPGLVLNRAEKQYRIISDGFFLHYKPLAVLFRSKMLKQLEQAGIEFPQYLHGFNWKVDCRSVGSGEGACEYLARYLFRGVISEHNLSRESKGRLSYRYTDSKSGQQQCLNLEDMQFLRLLKRHVLPQGFRRVREYGFLAPAGKKMVNLLRLLTRAPALELTTQKQKYRPQCPCCKGEMDLIIRGVDEKWGLKAVEKQKNEVQQQIARNDSTTKT